LYSSDISSETGAGEQLTDSFVIMAYAMLVPVVIFFALPLAVIGAFVAVAGHGHATNVITGLTVSLQAAVLPVAVIAAGICIAYSVDGGPFGVALAAAAMLSMAGIVVAAAILTPIGLVYLVMVILFRSLLVPVVILFGLPPAPIGAFVAVALTGRALDLSALIGMPVLIDIVVTNASVLLDLVQRPRHSAAGAAPCIGHVAWLPVLRALFL
jgi:HAE1 family hydrophobic/amphiphilic exporter-1